MTMYTEAQSYTLGMIEVNFCNNELQDKELDIITQAGKPQDICVQIYNKGTLPVSLNLEFLDSIITSDTIKDRTCNASDRPKRYFGNFIQPYRWRIDIPAQKTIKKIYHIQYPIWYSGISHGCLAYNVIENTIQENKNFSIRIRAIKFIDMLVSDSPAKQMIDISQVPKLIKSKNEYIVQIGIQNKGNISEKIHISSLLSNIFWYQKEFTFDVTVPANEEILLTTQSFIMPIYWGPYLFSSKIAYTPEFDFNITNKNQKHPSEIYIWGQKHIQKIFFIWTRQSWLMIWIFWLLIYVIFFKKKEKSLKHK